MKRIDYEREIFSMLFKASNGLQVYLDQLLSSDGLTAKQMFLLIVISSFGEDHPTLKDVAAKSSSSYQNVKQLALKIEKEGYVEISRDAQDRRKKKLRLTAKAMTFWKQRESVDLEAMDRLFEGCSDGDLHKCLDVINRLQMNLERMD